MSNTMNSTLTIVYPLVVLACPVVVPVVLSVGLFITDHKENFRIMSK